MTQLIVVNSKDQTLVCYEGDQLIHQYTVSTGKNGMGEQDGSGCTPRGWHRVHNIIGLDKDVNSVFVERVWTGEIYSEKLAKTFPDRDWILSRIIQLDGLELGRNKGGGVDSLRRYIYIHGTPESVPLGKPGSKGCVRMRNQDIIQLTSWLSIDTKVYIY